MPNVEFVCPNCNKKNKITLMGESQGIFEKKCIDCKAISELTVENNALIGTKSKIKKKSELGKKVPADYKKYDFADGHNTKKPFLGEGSYIFDFDCICNGFSHRWFTLLCT